VIVLLRADADGEVARRVIGELARLGAAARLVSDDTRRAVELLPPHAPLDAAARARLAALPGVEALLAPAEPRPLLRAADGPVVIATPRGPLDTQRELVLAFGPCSLDEESHLETVAAAAARAGARLLRGGAFKPRTSPYAFQGLGEPGLALCRKVADRHGLAIVAEVTSEAAVGPVAERCELLQIGARSMAQPPLLRAAARSGRPVLLKRGFGATVDEWLHAAEYLLEAGASGVILCERGIRSFEPGTRATLDVGGLALARLETRLPVWADPSHAAGTRALVVPLALAAVAAGADGLLVECHSDPALARSDGPQALSPAELQPLAIAAAEVARARRRNEEVCYPPWPQPNPSPRPSSASPRSSVA
jgi:3-deoxy-7-phosphoheptulonate synthase